MKSIKTYIWVRNETSRSKLPQMARTLVGNDFWSILEKWNMLIFHNYEEGHIVCWIYINLKKYSTNKQTPYSRGQVRCSGQGSMELLLSLIIPLSFSNEKLWLNCLKFKTGKSWYWNLCFLKFVFNLKARLIKHEIYEIYWCFCWKLKMFSDNGGLGELYF